MRKIATEKTINHPTLRVKVGTIDKKNPETLYVEGGVYITPNDSICLEKGKLRLIEKNFRRKIQNITTKNKYLSDKYILDFDVADDRLKLGKKTLVNFQCTLLQNKQCMLQFKDIVDNTNLYINDIIKEFYNELLSHHFILSKNRK